MSTDEGSIILETIIVITNIVTIIIGVIGNISACAVILCTKSMYTITNFYLLSLSISDILILISGPVIYITVYFNADFILFDDNNLAWSLTISWIAQTAINASILTISVFTVERFLAICFPFLVRLLSTISRVIKIIITIWIAAALFALIPGIQDYIQYQDMNSDVKEANAIFRLYFADVLAVLYFFMPITLITVMYVLIGIKLTARSRMRPTSTQSNCDTGKTLKMFVFIVLTFILSWAPFYISKVLWLHMVVASNGIWNPYGTPLWYLSIIKLALYPLSSALNPIIYTVMSKKFREAYKNLLFKSRIHVPNTINTKKHTNAFETAL